MNKQNRARKTRADKTMNFWQGCMSLKITFEEVEGIEAQEMTELFKDEE